MAKDTPPADEAKSKAKAETKPGTKSEAKAKSGPQAQAGEAQAPKKRSRGMLYAMLGLLVTAVAGAFAYQHLSGDSPAAVADASKADAAKPAAPKADASRPPQFVALEPFTVNLRADGNSDHFLQVGLTFQVASPPVADAIKQQMPVIRSNILLLLTGKTAGELGSVDGKGKLSGELLAAVRQTLPGEDPDKGVPAVHYSAFIIQ